MVQGQESIRALKGSLLKPFMELVDQSEHLGVVGKVLRRLCVHFGLCRLGLVAKMGRHGFFFLSFEKEGIRMRNGGSVERKVREERVKVRLVVFNEVMKEE